MKGIKSSLKVSPFIQSIFQLEFAPAPYFYLAAIDRALAEPHLLPHVDPKPLVILTTNPGGGLENQRRDFAKPTTYAEMAVSAPHDWQYLPPAARNRCRKMVHLATLCNANGIVLNVEALPFHSPYLPSKTAILQHSASDPLIQRYTTTLQQFLADKTVLAIAAVSSTTDLKSKDFRLSRWLEWKCELMGLRPTHATVIPIVQKQNEKVTAALWVDKQANRTAGLYLNMGTNGLPKSQGLDRIATVLC